MKYYIIAGEASGDLHGSNLIRALKKHDATAHFRAWGGDLMEMEGAELVKHYRDLAFMGFVEVLLNLRTITQNIRFCKNDLKDYAPDILILIDYPGFNLRIAEFAHRIGLKVVYYISPQVWAWKKNRVFKIKRTVDLMMVILPFEKDFYRQFAVDVHFVGHPLLDVLPPAGLMSLEQFKSVNQLDERPIIALLPGSRKQEIKLMLTEMLQMLDLYPDYQFVLAAAPAIETSYYKQIVKHRKLQILEGKTHELLYHATAALVTSGTATLEAAIIGTPEVVCYKGNPVSFAIARRIVDVQYISLVNLIMDREVVKELIQSELTRENLSIELNKILIGQKNREKILADYQELRDKLGGGGASENAARLIHECILNT